MTEAEETALDGIAQEILGSVATLRNLMAAGTTAADDLAQLLQDNSGIAAVGEAVTVLSSEFTAVQASVRTTVTAVAGVWEAALRDKEQEILQGLGALNTALAGADGRLGAISREIGAASTFVEEIGNAGDGLLDAAGDMADTVFESAAEITEAVSELIETQFEAFSEQISTLTENIDELLDDGATWVAEAIEAPIDNLREGISKAMEQFREFLSTEVKDAIIEAVTTEFLQPAKEQIDALVAKIEEQIEFLAKDVTSGAEGSAEKRQELKLVVEPLEEAINPVLSALNGLRGLAGTVGISI